ncbi:MAG: exo-alpha-sialidase [Clostridia bacterium]|nr:exo-alpha-sialidase [Clostridia bacterium]
MDKITLVHRDLFSCEAIVRKLSDDTLFLLAQCGGVWEPSTDNRVVAFKSVDGEVWSKPVDICEQNGRATYVSDIAVEGDKITAYILEHDGNFLAPRLYTRVSLDGGNSWTTEPVPYFHEDEFVLFRGTVFLPSGKKMIAYQHYPISAEESISLIREGKNILNSSLPAVNCGTLILDGEKITKSNDIKIYNTYAEKRLWQWPEPTFAVLKDGTYAMLLRVNGAGALYRSDSADGTVWSEPYRTDIPNPNNKPKLLNLENGAIALINTPNASVGFKYRNPLEIWISTDDMRTWEYRKKVLDFPGWLSYPDGFADGNRIRFSFEVNRHDVYYADCDVSDYLK